MAHVATLCYIIKGGKVLLIMKKRGLGAGKWNGPGGKVHEDENIQEAAVREVFEELLIVPDNPEHLGINEFYINGKLEWTVHVFVSSDYEGIEKETPEAAPKWFGLSQIPYDNMWPDDRMWFPLVLENKRFNAKFYFDDNEHIIDHKIEVLN